MLNDRCRVNKNESTRYREKKKEILSCWKKKLNEL